MLAVAVALPAMVSARTSAGSGGSANISSGNTRADSSANIDSNATESNSTESNSTESTSKSQIVPDIPKGDKGQEVVIRHGQNKTFYEYRVNGILKQIKVVPSHGPAYYLVPADGGGWIREDKSQLLIPSWVLFRW